MIYECDQCGKGLNWPKLEAAMDVIALAKSLQSLRRTQAELAQATAKLPKG